MLHVGDELSPGRSRAGAVDAYLWVKRPGYSNGACNGGPARVGAWWEKRAILRVKGGVAVVVHETLGMDDQRS